jgi:mannose-1-phosphate guanylyltransferase
MHAIILAGGEASRLQPLSHRTPKPLVPILNRPLIEHLLLHLRSHGIDEITLAVTRNESSVALEAALGDGSALGLELSYAYEETPLGSGGAIANAAAGWSEPFFVCNGDIITDVDLTAMHEEHDQEGAELTMFLQPVDDPSRFGVAVLNADGHVMHFHEKPEPPAPSNLANAGVWLFQPALLEELDRNTHSMVERELFPELCAAGRMIAGFQQATYWADIGTTERYLSANLELLAGAAPGLTEHDPPADGRLFDASAKLAAGATLDGPIVVGAGSTIEDGAHVTRSVIWDGVTIGTTATISDSVIASNATIGNGATIEGAVIADDASIPDNAHVPAGTIVQPGERFDAKASA